MESVDFLLLKPVEKLEIYTGLINRILISYSVTEIQAEAVEKLSEIWLVRRMSEVSVCRLLALSYVLWVDDALRKFPMNASKARKLSFMKVYNFFSVKTFYRLILLFI